MKFVSTRGQAPAVSASTAMLEGLAPDGGLYVPARWPSFDVERLSGTEPFPVLAARILRPFFSGDPLEGQLEALCERALNFPMPLTRKK